MKTFGQEYGYEPVRSAIQRETMDDALRAALWDALKITVFDRVDRYRFVEREDGEFGVSLAYRIWNGLFHKPIDTIPLPWNYVEKQLREHFFSCRWFEVYSFLQFVVQNSDRGAEKLKELAQSFLDREMAAYRFVDDRIVEITDEGEILEIESAILGASKPVATHLQAALALLSDRKAPDYRNSVKESICAVEAAARILTGDKSATLGQALKVLPQPLHPAFAGALSKLYGYTSDANGVRHALSDESEVDAAEARFMLIACSAFINLLRERANNALS